MTLETVDIPGIDILAAGGPYVGVGTAQGGDHYTVADLEQLAANARELGDEVKIPIKLGHSKEQQLLRESGLLDEHGAPAAGWIENVRVEGSKLVGDAKRVPAKLGGLMTSGAFRTRSLEQRGGYKSQKTGKTYGWIVDGLALLGGKAPAVRTLDDIVALYSAPDADLPKLDGEPPEGVKTINFEAGPIPGVRMADLTLKLTPEQAAEVAKALGVEKPEELGAPETLLAAIGAATTAATTAAVAPVKTELETAQKDLAAATTELATLKAAAGATDGEGAKELAEMLKKLAADAEQGVKAAQKLRELERDTLLDGAIRGGKLEPALRPQMVKLYDASPDLTRETIEALPKREDLFKVYGADGADITATGGGEADEDANRSEADKAERDALTRHLQAGLGTTREAVAS